MKVVTVTLNPAIDQTLSVPGFAAGRVNRVAESRSYAGGKGVNVACCLADLGVDRVDSIQLHNLVDVIEWETALGADGALEAASNVAMSGG